MATTVQPSASASEQVIHGIRHAKKRAFLAAYCVTGNLSASAQAAGCHRTSHYDWMESDEAYRAAFEAAHEVALDLLEQEARRRAVVGVAEPYVHGGKVVMDPEHPDQPLIKRTYSDTLLMFLLNGGRPDKFRNRYNVEHSGPDGGAIPVALEHRLAASVMDFAGQDVIDAEGHEIQPGDGL